MLSIGLTHGLGKLWCSHCMGYSDVVAMICVNHDAAIAALVAPTAMFVCYKLIESPTAEDLNVLI